MGFEIATWYDTWNATGLANLVQGKVPLNLANRYNLAFAEFALAESGGYMLQLKMPYADEVKKLIRKGAPGAAIYAGTGDTGIAAAVLDNRNNNNRATKNTVWYLQQHMLQGISIDAEQDGMAHVVELVTQLGPSFKKAGFGIAVSVPWPGRGPDPALRQQRRGSVQRCTWTRSSCRIIRLPIRRPTSRSGPAPASRPRS